MSAKISSQDTKSILHPIQTYIHLSPVIFILLFGPILAFISFFYWLLIVLPLSYLFHDLGKFTNSNDAWLDEEFINRPPRTSLVCTIALDGTMPLSTLQQLTIENVLKATLTNTKTIRYPEFKQYLTTFMGFRIWRNDPTFDITKHVIQKKKQEFLSPANAHKPFPDIVHQELLSQPYMKDHSPWEMIIIPDAFTDPDNPQQKSLLCVRIHHILGDGLSFWTVFVEGLCKRPFVIPKPVRPKLTFQDRLMFYITFIPNSIKCFGDVLQLLFQSHWHPWKIRNFWNDHYSSCNVSFSPQFTLNEVKQVAKPNGATVSSVIMSICAGAIRSCDVHVLGCQDVAAGWPVPRENHPPGMTNHLHCAIVMLPTSIACPLQRLQECQEIYVKARQSGMGQLLEICKTTYGQMLHAWASRFTINRLVPVGITNVAGNREKLTFASMNCSDLWGSCGTMPGTTGLVFVVNSFQDKIRIGIVARDSVVSAKQVEKLAKDCVYELENLLEITKKRYGPQIISEMSESPSIPRNGFRNSLRKKIPRT